jgi:Tfp pilus assembly protein PilW
MRQDRFLIGILIGIAVLVAAALAVFFTRSPVTYRSDQLPQDVVHNYALAVMNRDYDKAYGYLADLKNKPTLEEFRQAFVVGRLSPDQIGIKIGDADISGDTASVEVIMVYSMNDPFSSGSESAQHAQLLLQRGQWKLSSMPAYNLWDYGWYQDLPN